MQAETSTKGWKWSSPLCLIVFFQKSISNLSYLFVHNHYSILISLFHYSRIILHLKSVLFHILPLSYFFYQEAAIIISNLFLFVCFADKPLLEFGGKMKVLTGFSLLQHCLQRKKFFTIFTFPDWASYFFLKYSFILYNLLLICSYALICSIVWLMLLVFYSVSSTIMEIWSTFTHYCVTPKL